MIPALPSLRQIGILCAALSALALSIALVLARADARHWHKLADNTAALRLIDQQNWRETARRAVLAAQLNAARTAAEQAAISERSIHALALDRDRALAGYDRLRAQAAAYRGSPGHPDLSTEREATCRAYAAAACDEIPALLKAAQDNTDQLLRWIDWGGSQAAVATVPPAPVESSTPESSGR